MSYAPPPQGGAPHTLGTTVVGTADTTDTQGSGDTRLRNTAVDYLMSSVLDSRTS
jgi:hypothetical protein